MKHFEERAVVQKLIPSCIWFRYVDDTFTGLYEREVEVFKQYLNLDDNIKFTIETEQNKTLAFLKTCVCLKIVNKGEGISESDTCIPVFKLVVNHPVEH